MGSGSSKTRARETTLSIEQAKILKSRENLFRSFILPQLQAGVEAAEGFGQTAELAQVGLANVQRAFQAGSADLQRSLARRGVTGGLQQQGLVGLEVARAQSAAEVSNQAFLQNINQRNQLLAFSLQQSPQATTAAPITQNVTTEPGGIKGLFT